MLMPLLADDDEAAWVQWYFERVAPFPVEKAPAVVAMLRRSLNRPPSGEGGDRGGRGGPLALARVALALPTTPAGDASPSLPTEQHLRYALDLQRRFPAQDQVKGFFREYPKIAEKVRREVESEAKKTTAKAPSS